MDVHLYGILEMTSELRRFIATLESKTDQDLLRNSLDLLERCLESVLQYLDSWSLYESNVTSNHRILVLSFLIVT